MNNSAVDFNSYFLLVEAISNNAGLFLNEKRKCLCPEGVGISGHTCSKWAVAFILFLN